MANVSKDLYELYSSEVDTQHEELKEASEQLKAAAALQKSTAEIGGRITALATLGALHFAYEEEFFEKIPYDAKLKAEHIAEHTDFMKRLMSIQSRYVKGNAEANYIAVFFEDWLEIHVLTHDKKYMKILEQGMTGDEI